MYGRISKIVISERRDNSDNNVDIIMIIIMIII